jgi:YHS domain-containing protein
MKLALVLLSSMLLSGAALNAADAKPTGVPADYPLTKCVVSDETLGEMGKPVKVTHDGTDVYLCCKSCIKDFNKEPAKYVEKVKSAPKKK